MQTHNKDRHAFNPSWEIMPASLGDVLYGHKIHDQTIEDLKAINPLVIFSDNEYMDDSSVHFLDGGYTNIVFGSAITSIKKREPARVTLKVIEIFHLNDFNDLTDMIAELEPLAAAEIAELSTAKGAEND